MPTTNPQTLLRCLALAAPVFATTALHAQAVSNIQQVLAQCGTNTSVPPPIGSSNTLNASGTCSTTQGGTGSINDASSYILAAGGVIHVINTANADLRTHLFNPSGARAQGVADFSYPMNDIIFTNTANPSMVGPVNASLNFVVQLQASVSGPADPLQSTLPRSFNSVRAILGSVTTIGGYDLRPSGPITSGALIGYPNDFSPLHLTTPSQTFTLTQPVTVQFIAQCSQTALYNSVAPSPRTGSATTDVRISYPCGTPVFNLPPGITANSVSLGIVNNIWVNGPCGPTCDTIDFNTDGLFPDTADIDDFLTVFSGGPCSTGAGGCGDLDFNNDSLFPDTADIDSLLSVFSGGPCL